MNFEGEVIDRLARIEEKIQSHEGEHRNLNRRLGALEEEQTFRSRVTILVSGVTSAVVATVGQFVAALKG